MDFNEKYKNLLLSCVNGIMKLSKCYEDDNQTNLFLLQTARSLQEIILHKNDDEYKIKDYVISENNYFPNCVNNDFINLLWENDLDIINENLNLIFKVIEKYPNMKDEHTQNCIKNIKSVVKKKHRIFIKKIQNL